MRPLAAAAIGFAAVLLTGAAQTAMTVREFLAAADRIPRNPTAVLRGDTRRLMTGSPAPWRT